MNTKSGKKILSELIDRLNGVHIEGENMKNQSRQAKEYLNQIRKIDRLINRLLSTLSGLRSTMLSQKHDLNPAKVRTSGTQNAMEDSVNKIVDLETEINRRIDELTALKQDALERINRVPDLDQQNVLIARYVSGNKWEKIALDLNYSISQIYRMHGIALLKFAEANPDILKDDSK